MLPRVLWIPRRLKCPRAGDRGLAHIWQRGCGAWSSSEDTRAEETSGRECSRTEGQPRGCLGLERVYVVCVWFFMCVVCVLNMLCTHTHMYFACVLCSTYTYYILYRCSVMWRVLYVYMFCVYFEGIHDPCSVHVTQHVYMCYMYGYIYVICFKYVHLSVMYFVLVFDFWGQGYSV